MDWRGLHNASSGSALGMGSPVPSVKLISSLLTLSHSNSHGREEVDHGLARSA
jgi:hypothetical protein